MLALRIILLLWMAVSTLVFIGCWFVGIGVYLRLATELARLKTPRDAQRARSARVREICRDPSHPLHGRARRLLRLVWIAGLAWLSGILALLAFAVALHTGSHPG